MMSLSKIPIIMLLLKQAEDKLVKLDEPVTVQPQDLDPQYGSLWLRGSGYQITVREAVRLAIEESDNTAIHLIRRVVISHSTNPKDTLGGLDVHNILRVDSNGVSTNVKSYSDMLRCLYTACQTSPADSRMILGYMTRTHDSAIRDGSSPGTTVADKFGYFDKAGQEHLYSDCGIVYSSNGNYILCIMTLHPTANIRQQSVGLSKIVQQGVAP